MKTLTEKYQALKEGKFSKKQFLRDSRLAHPTLITQFNSPDDAISILKSKGYIHEARVQENTHEVEVDILDTISPNQIKKGIRYELEEMGVKSVSVTKEEWAKAKDKVRKNIEKDQNYYVHKLAGIKPVKHDKRPDVMKEVPSVKNKDVGTKTGQKKVKDQHNQMEKVKLNEIKEVVKRLIVKTLNEGMSDQEYSDAKEAERLEKHPERKKIKAVQALVKKEKPVKEASRPVQLDVVFNDTEDYIRAKQWFSEESEFYASSEHDEFQTLSFEVTDQDDAAATERAIDQELQGSEIQSWRFELQENVVKEEPSEKGKELTLTSDELERLRKGETVKLRDGSRMKLVKTPTK